MPPFIVAALAKAAPYVIAAGVFIGLGVWIAHKAPFIGLDATVSRLTQDRNAWQTSANQFKAALASERAAFAQDAALRGQEQAQAVQALTTADKACAARVATARQSSAAIAAITTKAPTYDQNHCPVRVLVAPDSLRNALGYPAASGG
jgi:hypothetical protein